MSLKREPNKSGNGSYYIALDCTGVPHKVPTLQRNVKLSLDLVGRLLLGVPSPPQYEYEEEPHGHQPHDGAQSRCCCQACVGSWETQITDQDERLVAGAERSVNTECLQVRSSRLTEQLSEPAVLLARHMNFPDMLFVRLLSLRVPCRSSARQAHSYTSWLHTVTH